jgi:DNA-binding transcriptional LysR family regulator
MNADLDLRQLRAFATLCQEGGLTAAARVLGVTQSAVSHAIKLLQEDLGCPLYYQQGRGIRLTREGELLRTQAEKLLLEMERIRPLLRASTGSGEGTLRCGAAVTAVRFLLPPVLREFRECFPGYAAAIEVADTATLVGKLTGGKLDLVLGLTPADTAGLAVRPVFRDELAFLFHRGHPWESVEKPSPREIAADTYIVNPRGSVTFRLLEEHFLGLGIRPRSLIEVDSLEASLELAKTGVGIAVAAPWVLREMTGGASLDFRPLEPAVTREWAVLTPRNRPLSLAEQTFLGLCEEVGKNLALRQDPPPDPP